MYKRYEHTQFGYLIFTTLCVLLLFMLLVMYFSEFKTAVFITLLVVVLLLWQFIRLKVEIASEFLRIKFGVGIIHKKIPLAKIKSCREVRNRWYYGWGIKTTPHGTLYNVSGLLAVEIEMKDGRKYRIGTDEPEKLVQAIQESIGT